MTTKILSVFLFLTFVFGLESSMAQKAPHPDPHRFDREIEHFMTYDKKNSFPAHAILFLGSSSIRKWFTHEAFPEFPVINRGFGGSQLSDVLYFYDQLLKKYNPQMIVFYEGDNDIAAGKSAEEVFADYRTFIQRLLNDFPHIKLIYIPIKPSVARWNLWPEMKKANEKIQTFNEKHSNLYDVDLVSPLLTKNGVPDSTLFIKDGLHLNARGYARWNEKLLPVLRKLYVAGKK